MTNNFTPAKAGGQRPRLSKEEYAEKMRKEKEAVYQMADETATGIVASPEKFKAFLDTQSRLDRYSAVNALLILSSCPKQVSLKTLTIGAKTTSKSRKVLRAFLFLNLLNMQSVTVQPEFPTM